MVAVSLDTSFLISFADPARPHHKAALEYFRHCKENGIPMHLSVVAAGEFEVGQPVSDLPLNNLRIIPYNLLHAKRAAQLYKALRRQDTSGVGRRPVILNDLKIIAQAAEENAPYILTEDEATLTKMCQRLIDGAACTVQTLVLTDGFLPGKLKLTQSTDDSDEEEE